MACAPAAEDSPLYDDITCKICLELPKDPVQCQRNEHYYCRNCIMQHLRRDRSCPVCRQKLTMKTLRPAPRIVRDLIAQTPQNQLYKCWYVKRGCKVALRQEELSLHQDKCGFAPVLCSNEGCGRMVNKAELDCHKEACAFRMVYCDVCDKSMVHIEFQKHGCVLRQELDEVKILLKELNSSVKQLQREVIDFRESSPSGLQGKPHNSSVDRSEQTDAGNSSPARASTSTGESARIVVAGGHNTSTMKSYEVFDWTTKTWILYENSLVYDHYYASSFPYCGNIIICGGMMSKGIDCLEATKTQARRYPGSMPSLGKAARWGNHVMTVDEDDKSVVSIPLFLPYVQQEEFKCSEKIGKYNGAESVIDGLVLLGGISENSLPREETLSSCVHLYNPVCKRKTSLAPLPYDCQVSKMATVSYGNNVLVIGGENNRQLASKKVIKYDVSTGRCEPLPDMLEARIGCAAVKLGDAIIVMGGRRGHEALRSVECLVLGENTWHQLPPMQCKREGATAAVKPLKPQLHLVNFLTRLLPHNGLVLLFFGFFMVVVRLLICGLH